MTIGNWTGLWHGFGSHFHKAANAFPLAHGRDARPRADHDGPAFLVHMEGFVNLILVRKPQQQSTHLGGTEMADHGRAGSDGMYPLPGYCPLLSLWGDDADFAALAVEAQGWHQWAAVGLDVALPQKAHHYATN